MKTKQKQKLSSEGTVIQELANILDKLYPKDIIVQNEYLKPNLEKEISFPYRPLFFIPKQKIIVEFDDSSCYKDYIKQLKTIRIDEILKNNGTKVIRIPYYIQLSSEVIRYYFGKTLKVKQRDLHGFLENTALDVFNFNEGGFKKFHNEMKDILDAIPNVYMEVMTSIYQRLSEAHKKYNRVCHVAQSIGWFAPRPLADLLVLYHSMTTGENLVPAEEYTGQLQELFDDIDFSALTKQ